MKKSLKRIQQIFPQVTKVCDATKTIEIEVIDEDCKKGDKKSPESCAMARACIRQRVADGAIIGLSYSWIIKGNKATRYLTSVAVGREITSFDRHHDFAAGRHYKLSKVSPSNLLEKRHNFKKAPKRGKYNEPKQKVHYTDKVRTIK